MAQNPTPAAVVAQANNNAWWNTEPLVAKAAAVGFATSVLIAAGAFGLVTEEQRTVIIEQVGNVTFGVFVILPIAVSLVTALWSRVSTWSGRSVARAAVESAKTGVPTLLPPP